MKNGQDLTKAMLIMTRNIVRPIEPADGKLFTADELHKYVGGYIEVVHPQFLPNMFKHMLMIVNEDGHRLKLPVNSIATGFYRHNMILGDVVLINKNQID